ncbi:MAG: hypothetical protein LBR53_10920 [Deltaproteobacteria bacterium]|nr:hypothetical protein [Deltaproteobacteria bacterium]
MSSPNVSGFKTEAKKSPADIFSLPPRKNGRIEKKTNRIKNKTEKKRSEEKQTGEKQTEYKQTGEKQTE